MKGMGAGLSAVIVADIGHRLLLPSALGRGSGCLLACPHDTLWSLGPRPAPGCGNRAPRQAPACSKHRGGVREQLSLTPQTVVVPLLCARHCAGCGGVTESSGTRRGLCPHGAPNVTGDTGFKQRAALTRGTTAVTAVGATARAGGHPLEGQGFGADGPEPRSWDPKGRELTQRKGKGSRRMGLCRAE